MQAGRQLGMQVGRQAATWLDRSIGPAERARRGVRVEATDTPLAEYEGHHLGDARQLGGRRPQGAEHLVRVRVRARVRVRVRVRARVRARVRGKVRVGVTG